MKSENYPAFPAPEVEPQQLETLTITLPARVLLFNDDWHVFDEVVEQITKATGCFRHVAEDLTTQVHSFGSAIVFDGDIFDCITVSTVLQEIALNTQIVCE